MLSQKTINIIPCSIEINGMKTTHKADKIKT